MLAFAVYFDHDLWIIHVSAKGIHWDIFSKTLQGTVLEMLYTCVNNVWIQVFITWALNVITLGFNLVPGMQVNKRDREREREMESSLLIVSMY